MSQPNQSIREFTEKFFINLRCTLQKEGNLLRVSNVPIDFEKFSGKNQPYLLAFDSESATPDAELMIKGSYLLKVMMEYLENRGQTTLLKIVFDFDIQDLFLKKFTPRNCTLSIMNRKQDYKTLTRFTFLTNLQYLNEREKIVSSIVIRNKDVLNIALDKFNSIEGRKEDITQTDIPSDYNLAKEALKPIISPKLDQVKIMLQSQLEKEIDRVKNHYSQLRKEHELSISKVNQQIASLEQEKIKSQDPSIDAKISKIRESLKNTQDQNILDKIKKEEEFFISDEIHKRNLAISNKLINTSIFYYPVYSLMPFLKTSDGGRFVEVTYDPLEDSWSDLKCDICQENLKDLVVCSGGHLTCGKCASKCPMCNKEACTKCLEKKCNRCNKEMCSQCSSKCTKCHNYSCKSHTLNNPGTPKICLNCSKQCDSCYKQFHPSHLRKNSQGKSLCMNCHRKEINDKTLSNIFSKD